MTHNKRALGIVHFLRGRGAGGIWGGEVSPKKKNGLEGGPSKINKGKGGGHVKYYLYWRGVVGKNVVTGGSHATF